MLSSNILEIKSQIRNYQILFVDDFSHNLEEDLSNNSFFIIDETVFSLYHPRFKDIIKQNNYLIVKAIEENKSLDYVKVVIRSLISDNIKKNNKLVAIGGGIIQDITGFVASILFRGMEWNFYPTTLLAQSDSCIGSKTSINVDEFKNQLGTFYPPGRIVLDVNFLQTLSETDIRSGLGEIIKVHLLDGRESLNYLLTHFGEVWTNKTILKELIYRSLNIKKRVIEKDEFDRDYRNIMNYGHTFGHAIESFTNYTICHGQAVTVGMGLANYISLQLGMLSEESYSEMEQIIDKNSPPLSFHQNLLDLFFKALAKDKKNVGEKLSVILIRYPGKMEKVQLPFDDRLKKYIIDYFLIKKSLKNFITIK